MKYPTWLKRFQKDSAAHWPVGMPVVAVLWEDATFHDGTRKDSDGLMLALTVGVVAKADAKMVQLAHEVFADKTERGVTTIPVGMIRDVHLLASPKEVFSAT